MKKLYIKDPAVLILAFYFGSGIVLRLFSTIDILPPCLFTALFDIHCPGCGLTGAAIHLAKFEFLDAWRSNPLIYLIVPYFLIEVINFFRANLGSGN